MTHFKSILFVILLMTTHCTVNQEPAGYPEDFRFRLKTATFDYDSGTQQYIYYNQSVVVPLTDTELEAIYAYALDIGFMSFPDEFDCLGQIGTTPCLFTELTIRYDNLYNQSANDRCCTQMNHFQQARFDELVQRIWTILDSKAEVRNLPRIDIALTGKPAAAVIFTKQAMPAREERI